MELDLRLSMLLEWWQALPADPDLPAITAIDAPALSPWLGDLGIVEPTGEPVRFRVRLAGVNLRAVDNRDATGHFLDEIAPAPILAEVERPYRLCLAHRRPVADHLRLHERPHVRIERLLLPFGPQVDRILVGLIRLGEITTADAPRLLAERKADMTVSVL